MGFLNVGKQEIVSRNWASLQVVQRSRKNRDIKKEYCINVRNVYCTRYRNFGADKQTCVKAHLQHELNCEPRVVMCSLLITLKAS